jgi:hypothetical protein
VSLTVRLEDEGGNLLDEGPSADTDFDRAVAALDPATYPWLSTIDTYGDTTFNHLQAPRILEELSRLKAANPAGIWTELDGVIRLAERCRDEGPNVYLKFYGD